MDTKPNAGHAAGVGALAQSFDCLSEEDFCLLAGIEPGTAQSWRKRGTGPSYILLGNRFLYPRSAVAEYLQTKVRERRQGVDVREVL